MQSLPRPPDTKSLPASVKIRSGPLVPVTRSEPLVPTSATASPKRVAPQGPTRTESRVVSGTVLAPLAPSTTTCTHAPLCCCEVPGGHGPLPAWTTVTHAPVAGSKLALPGQALGGGGA